MSVKLFGCFRFLFQSCFLRLATGHLESYRVSNIESISSITWSLVIVGFSTDFISNISIASLAILFLLTMSKSATITVSSSIPAHLLFQSLLSWNSPQDKYILLLLLTNLGARAGVTRGGKRGALNAETGLVKTIERVEFQSLFLRNLLLDSVHSSLPRIQAHNCSDPRLRSMSRPGATPASNRYHKDVSHFTEIYSF